MKGSLETVVVVVLVAIFVTELFSDEGETGELMVVVKTTRSKIQTEFKKAMELTLCADENIASPQNLCWLSFLQVCCCCGFSTLFSFSDTCVVNKKDVYRLQEGKDEPIDPGTFVKMFVQRLPFWDLDRHTLDASDPFFSEKETLDLVERVTAFIFRLSQNKPSKTNEKRPKVLVVGAGPVGLIHALEAFSAGI